MVEKIYFLQKGLHVNRIMRDISFINAKIIDYQFYIIRISIDWQFEKIKLGNMIRNYIERTPFLECPFF